MAQYLVRGAYVDPGPLLPPGQVADMIERSVSPSWEAIAELQKQGKIVGGGLVAADRAVVLLVEADSNDEVGTLIHDLPFWGLVKWEVTPLESFESRSALDSQQIERLRAMA